MNFGKSRLRHRSAEMSLVPLIDIFLNILIFFLITTTFASTSLFFVDLPEAKNAEGTTERKMISINVAASGDISIDRKVVSLEQLRGELVGVAEKDRTNFPVLLRADRGSSHGRVVSVIDVLRGSGFLNVGIATKGESAE